MKRSYFSLILGLTLAVAILLVLLPTSSIASGQATDSRIFVNANIVTPGDGSSWDMAYKYLQDALAVAEAGDQIWVAQGVYYPDEGAGQTEYDPESTFELINGVFLYGGFIGDDEDSLNDRDWENNLTILSGDLEGNDDTSEDNIVTNTDNINGTNAYHVVTARYETTATIDGFIITAGKAETELEHHGGGMHNINSSPTLNNIIFSGNWADQYGGGMHNLGGNSTLNNITFSNNHAKFGGAMHNEYSNSIMNDVTFSDNHAETRGGGMYNIFSDAILTDIAFTGNHVTGEPSSGGGMSSSNSTLTLTHVTFNNNQAVYSGGGMYNDVDCRITLAHVTFSSNQANWGGGMYNTVIDDSIFTYVTFSDNLATEDGGGMVNSNSTLTLTHATFNNNQAIVNGGGIYNLSSHPTLVNITISGNSAEDGGGIANFNESKPTLTNIILKGNQASNRGGAMFNVYDSNATLNLVTISGNQANSGSGIYNFMSDPTLVNCIVWGNGTTDEIEITNLESTPAISFSNIRGYDGEGNIASPPEFVAPISAAFAPTTSGNYHLSIDSPAIDAGDPAFVDILGGDLDGSPRIVDGKRDGVAIVDMGAYEFDYEFDYRIYVDHAAEGPGHNGVSWTNAFTNVQDALAIARAGNEIWVAEGVYYPDEGKDEDDNSPFSTFEIEQGVKLYGGFAGGVEEDSLDDRDWENNPTILSGDLEGNDTSEDNIVTNTDNINGTNAYHVVSSYGVTETARLDGFVITAGNADNENGGGMYNFRSSPTVANVTFCGNLADDGGGVYNGDSSNPVIENVTFSGNQANQYGGGMYNDASNPTLTEITFANNQAENRGGGMYNHFGSSPTLTDATFNGNWANDGGAVFNYTEYFTLTRVIFRDNHATADGGGMYNYENSNPILFNVLFSGNEAGSDGGGMYNYRSNPTLINVTLSGNHTTDSAGGMYNNLSNPTLTNVILWGNQTDGEDPDIHNTAGSTPAINYSDIGGGVPAGTDNLSQDPHFVDPDGGDYHLSSISPVIDKGNNASLPETIITDLDGRARYIDGNDSGEAVVDMGAYEFQTTLATHSLTVTLAGSGSGSVSSSPPGIICPGNCSQIFPTGSAITLTATASDTSTFAGWSGACTSSEPACTVVIDADKSATATFNIIVASENRVYLPLVLR